MRAEDMQDFFKAWDQSASIYRLPPANGEAKKMVFIMLAKFELSEIKHALQIHMTDPERGVYPPKPADIVRVIQLHTGNQYPGAEEAWALFPRDESLSACICEEMARAWGVASELDEISGRMAFKETYNREVAKSQQLGKRPKWFITAGQDKQHLEQVAMDAVVQSLMSPSAAKVYLPHIPLDDIQKLADKQVTPNRLLEDHAQTVNSLEQLLLSAPAEQVASAESAKQHLARIKALFTTKFDDKREDAA